MMSFDVLRGGRGEKYKRRQEGIKKSFSVMRRLNIRKRRRDDWKRFRRRERRKEEMNIYKKRRIL